MFRTGTICGNELQFCSIREAAKLTGLSEYCLRKMLKAGQLPGVYSGKKFLVNLQALKRMLNSTTVEEQRMRAAVNQ